jgi:hypothetical protein
MSKSSNIKQIPTNGANPPAQADESDAPAAVRDFIDQVPPAVAPLFSDPPVLRTEDPNAYKALLNEVAATIKPKDLIEFWWTRDFTDLTWEILRYRKMRKAILETGELAALRARYRELLDDGKPSGANLDWEAAQWADNWRTDPRLREPGAETGVTEEELAALVYIYRQKEIAGLEKQIAGAESRRNKLLREMQSHRETAAYREQLEKLARPPERKGNALTPSFERWAKVLEEQRKRQLTGL